MDGCQEGKDREAADYQILPIRRKDENESAAFHQRRKARDAEWHQEQAENLPAVELSRRVCTGGTQDEGNADDGAEAEGREPQARNGIEVTHQDDGVPNEVAPEGLSGAVECGEVGKERLHAMAGIEQQDGSNRQGYS